MSKRYYIELSRKDVGLVSYFPGLKTKDNKWNEWIEDILIPVIKPISKRKSAKIRETPITFWVSVRGTARSRAEVFIFMTPAYPGAVIEKAMEEALQSIKGGNVHAGREPIPEDAVPCLQVFRGKLIRFYSPSNIYKWFDMPTVEWKDKAPKLDYYPILDDDELYKVDVPIEEAELPLVEARILEEYIASGKECRKYQQALIPIARETE